MPPKNRIQETKNNGIKFSTPIRGEGTDDNPYRPAILDAEPHGYYHFDVDASDDPTTTNPRAILWINTKRSPQSAIDAVENTGAPPDTTPLD